MVRTMASVLPKASIDSGNGKCRNKLRGIRFSRISNMKKWKQTVIFVRKGKKARGKGKDKRKEFAESFLP
jgi:hypothetical protein